MILNGPEKPPIEDVLAHHGIKGQKWGVRKGKSVTGVSRAGGAKIEKNKRLESQIRQAHAGTKFKVSTALGRKIIGEQKQTENWNKIISSLHAQNDRIKSGNTTIADKFNILNSVSLADLVITQTPR